MMSMRIRFGRARGAIAAVIVVVAVGACTSAPKVRVDKDASTNLAQYKTFAWFEEQESAKPAPPADDKTAAKQGAQPAPAKVSTLVQNRVHAAVAAALIAKGYTFDERNPSFRVHYLLNVGERPKESGMRIGLGAGGGSGNVGGGVGVSLPIGKRTESFGSLTIDMIDAARNAQLWSGTYQQKVASVDVGEADVQKLVTTILEKYPAHAP